MNQNDSIGGYAAKVVQLWSAQARCVEHLPPQAEAVLGPVPKHELQVVWLALAVQRHGHV